MGMRVMCEKGYQFVQNMTTYSLWVYKGDVCVVAAMLDGPLTRRLMLDILRQIEGRKGNG